MEIKNGIYPTMITPFKEDNTVDYESLERMVHWYIEKGCHGLFAVCQSSEMFFLSLEERIQIAKFIRNTAGNSITVVASGHITSDNCKAERELKLMYETGVDAVVLISNRFANEGETEDVWIRNFLDLSKRMGSVPLGIYECPYPYKLLLSERLIEFMIDNANIEFIKDTCCDEKILEKRLDILKNSKSKLFNANSATLLSSLKNGASGYSGIMANFHPELYVRLYNEFAKNGATDEVKLLSSFAGVTSLIETCAYPLCAKYFNMKEGRIKNILSRVPNKKLKDMDILLTEQLVLLQSLIKHQI